MDFILNKLKNLHISGASINLPNSVVSNSGVVIGGLQKDINESDKEQTLLHDRVKSAPTSDIRTKMADQHIDLKENMKAVVVADASSIGNKSVSLNDILIGSPKIGLVLVDNECGDNIYKNVEPNNIVTHAAIFDRGDQILPEMCTFQPVLNQPTIALGQKEPVIVNQSNDRSMPNIVNNTLQSDQPELVLSMDSAIQMSSIVKPEIRGENIRPSQRKPPNSTFIENQPVLSEVQINDLQTLDKETALIVSSVPLGKGLSQKEVNLLNEAAEIDSSPLVPIITQNVEIASTTPEKLEEKASFSVEQSSSTVVVLEGSRKGYKEMLEDSLTAMKRLANTTEQIAMSREESVNIAIKHAADAKIAAEMPRKTVDDAEKRRSELGGEFKQQNATKPLEEDKPQIANGVPPISTATKTNVVTSGPVNTLIAVPQNSSVTPIMQVLDEKLLEAKIVDLSAVLQINSQLSGPKEDKVLAIINTTENDSIGNPLFIQLESESNSGNSKNNNSGINQTQQEDATKSEVSLLHNLSNVAFPIESKKMNPEHEVKEILNDLVNTVPIAPARNVEAPSVTESTSDFNKAPSMRVPIQHLPQTKSDLSVVCPEINGGETNTIESVKKNLLTIFDNFDSNQPIVINNPIKETKSTVNKIEMNETTSLPQAENDDITQTSQMVGIQITQPDSLVNVTNETKHLTEPFLDATINPLDPIIKHEAIHSLNHEENIVPQISHVSEPPKSEKFQQLNTEINSNNGKINSTLEAVILNQILDQEYASGVIPTLAEKRNHNNLLTHNGRTLENIILNQILEHNNLCSPIDEISDSKSVETQNSTDFQISDIDVTSADNFIEFVDEIIDFALRKVDFLKVNDIQNLQPLTPVPEVSEETSDYYDYLFTPTVEKQNINFPTLESFEIEELQAKVMEQADALYLNETPIDPQLHTLSVVPESPKINELQAKAMEQAHELNLNETIAEFMYLHSADNKSKVSAEPIEMNVNVETQRKLRPPIAIAAVIEKPTTQPIQSVLTNSQTSNFSDSLNTSQTESFFLGDAPSMHRSQSNRPQSPMDTSQQKLSQSMNEVYFDKRLDITAKRSFRKERDQKLMQKSKKDHFNENLNREKSQEPQKMINTHTPRDSLENLNEIETYSVATEHNKLDKSLVLDPQIEKQENEEPDDNKNNKMVQKESLKDSLENLVDTVEHKETGASHIKRHEEMEQTIRDSLENLVEAVEAISKSVKQDEELNQNENRRNTFPVEENCNIDKKCNSKAKKTNDITIVIDKAQQKGIESDVKPSVEENVIHNTIYAPNSVVQSVENVTSVVISKDLNNAKEHKDVTMSLDIMNGGDKLGSNKYYESVSDEPKIKTGFIMAEYRKPVGSSNGDLDKIIDEYESKEESLIRRLTDKEKTITKMTGVMEAYEKTIAEMIAEKEQLVQEYEKKCVNLKSDADLNAQHLLSLEDTFADLHAKYERSKQITIGLKTNEEELRNGNMKNLELLNAQEIRYEKMKSHAIGQLQIANEKLEHLQRAHAQETTKLKALLKREELARSSLTEQLQQKIRENEELVKICEELIGKE